MRMRKNKDEAVSPVIAIILMVAITVVLAGVLYVWVTQFGAGGTGDITISGNFKDSKFGDDQEFYFQFTAPSQDIEFKDVTIILENGSVREATVKQVDMVENAQSSTSQKIYDAKATDVSAGNITLFDNNANGQLDSGDKLFLNPDAGESWTTWVLKIQVSGKPAMDLKIPSS